MRPLKPITDKAMQSRREQAQELRTKASRIKHGYLSIFPFETRALVAQQLEDLADKIENELSPYINPEAVE